MENILFYRGICVKTNKWVQGDLINNDEHHYMIGTIIHDGGNSFDEPPSDHYETFEVIRETIGLISDIQASNKPAFFAVGDIVKIPDNYDDYGIYSGEIYEIYFKNGGFRFKPKRPNCRGFYLEDDKTFELLGNVHQNLYLLKE